MSRYEFSVTYVRFEEDGNYYEDRKVIVDNPEVVTDKLAFQVCVMKAFDNKAKNETVVTIQCVGKEE